MTVGMTEKNFDINANVVVRMVDVGGQRSERRKWIRWFAGIDCVIFIAAISEFDQVLFEDGETNRFLESLAVWRELQLKKEFTNTRFVLFLNKVDLFQEKIKTTRISDYLDDYKGEEHNYDDAVTFFTDKYLEGCSSRHVRVYHTTATDVDLMDNVLDNVKEALLLQAINNSF